MNLPKTPVVTLGLSMIHLRDDPFATSTFYHACLSFAANSAPHQRPMGGALVDLISVIATNELTSRMLGS